VINDIFCRSHVFPRDVLRDISYPSHVFLHDVLLDIFCRSHVLPHGAFFGILRPFHVFPCGVLSDIFYVPQVFPHGVFLCIPYRFFLPFQDGETANFFFSSNVTCSFEVFSQSLIAFSKALILVIYKGENIGREDESCERP
jgi:hypothetical protein